MDILYSKHAREQMVARGISEREVTEGIARGSKHLQHPGKIVSCHKYYCVVYASIRNAHYVITVTPRW